MNPPENQGLLQLVPVINRNDDDHRAKHLVLK
ncbi:hypothetical protein OKW12_001909 [Pseudomonas silensiensis]|nr:hypothetical protein [Pseudomonas silensiensis]